jgi:hypothetical protein
VFFSAAMYPRILCYNGGFISLFFIITNLTGTLIGVMIVIILVAFPFESLFL